MKEITMKNIRGKEIFLGEEPLQRFLAEVRGEVIFEHEDRYDDARRVWNGMIDKRPALIVRCAGPADVIASVNFAREHGLLFSVRGGGHNVAGNAVCDGGMVIDLSGMKSVHVDPDRRTVRAQAGATLADVDHETRPFGLAVPLGLVSATGISGLTLHGGMGWLLRKHGLTCDNLLSADIVTADGRLIKASNEEHRGLFWALRGGGGSFGAVVSLEYQAHPVGPEVWMAAPMYSMSKAESALRFFRGFMARAPEDLGALASLWSAPVEETIPESVRGAPVVVFLAVYSGPLEKGEEIIRPLREFDTPVVDLSGARRFVDVQKFLDADYPDGMYYYWKSLYLNDLDDETIKTLVAHATTRPSPLTSIDIWALGGFFSRVPADETPFARRNAPYMAAFESNWKNALESPVHVEWTRRVYKDMERFSRGSYLNFPGFGEEGEELLKGAYESNYERLKAVKAEYDPHNLFRGNLNIRPAG
ncbi:MAG: FAD-binding oxidoreductase [Syntrophobacteraceae bacterium]|nr:FAD-binding oxidoreductase [Syntrophobacteraceae bacterium]